MTRGMHHTYIAYEYSELIKTNCLKTRQTAGGQIAESMQQMNDEYSEYIWAKIADEIVLSNNKRNEPNNQSKSLDNEWDPIIY